MPKAKLTNTFAKRAKCPTNLKKVEYFDTDLTGFMLEAEASTKYNTS